MRMWGLVAVLMAVTGTLALPATAAPIHWQPAGWGGGGFYWSCAFDPLVDGAIYMGGDVAGVYKSTDHGMQWRLINNGLPDYGVFSLAVDPINSKTVYAATSGGLAKSIDGGDHWQMLPHTGHNDLRITGEKDKSIRSVAVDPTNSSIVYAGSPAGKVYKSTDAGQTWKAVYQKDAHQNADNGLRVQFGKVDGEYYGGIWLPLAFPAGVKSADCVGFGFNFKGEQAEPRDCFLTLKTTSGASYRSKNLHALFTNGQQRDVVFTAADFSIDPDYAKQHPDQAKALPATPDWPTVNRMDLVCVGSLPDAASVGIFGRLFFALTHTADGQAATPEKPILETVSDFATNKQVGTYGNVRIGEPLAGSIYSVAVASKSPSVVLAATADSGLVLSQDGGQTWSELKTPQRASSAAFAAGDPNTIYGSFFTDGIWKSTDMGHTWNRSSQGLSKDFSVTEVVVSPANPQDVYAIGSAGWGGGFYFSHDGGQTWNASSTISADPGTDPTLPKESVKTGLSTPTNLSLNPLNPKELFISANWRSCLSEDGGLTWTERDRGADISCVYDIQFQGNRTYAAAMDEGTLVSDDDGASWRQLWPLKWDPAVSGHNWRLAITNHGGVDHILATCSPWDTKYPNRVILSDDGGKTYTVATAGLPDYIIGPNTMWGMGYARALAVDPKDPSVVYLGIDGDPSDGKSGGGLFKSVDGGHTWKQLANQPGSRRIFLGLAVDPTDPNRIYWGACGNGGGLYRSEDGGGAWQKVFSQEAWIFNVVVSPAGVVYCPGANLWRSTDHGHTWKKLTNFANGRQIIGLAVDPRDEKTLWFSTTTWDGSSNGAVYKSTDGGATWQNITGDLPYVKPLVLRFNPATSELWAGGVGLFKLKQ